MSNTDAPTYRSRNTSVAPSGAVSAPAARGAALQFLAQLAKEVSSGTVDLPCFPDVVIRIRQALEDPKTTPGHTVMIVGTEPRLAAKLLQTANSAAFNSNGKPLTDLRSAITRLGQQLVQSAAMAFAVQQMQEEKSLRSIARPLNELWRECIAVASICHVVARRTKLSSDEAFLTGLLHDIGRLYIMVRAVGQANAFNADPSFIEMVGGWHPQIGKALLENWGFAQEMSDAVGDQTEYERRRHQEPDLADILIASIILSNALQTPAPRIIDMAGVTAFQSLGLEEEDCANILTHAEYQLGSLHDALGC